MAAGASPPSAASSARGSRLLDCIETRQLPHPKRFPDAAHVYAWYRRAIILIDD
jgi:hypothetical protein